MVTFQGILSACLVCVVNKDIPAIRIVREW